MIGIEKSEVETTEQYSNTVAKFEIKSSGKNNENNISKRNCGHMKWFE
jgi:hypothetical protein